MIVNIVEIQVSRYKILIMCFVTSTGAVTPVCERSDHLYRSGDWLVREIGFCFQPTHFPRKMGLVQIESNS